MDWKYYNGAMLATNAPHETANTACIEDGSLWKAKGRPLFARWTSDFDCGYETNWWYCIKDEPFDLQALKAKRRYEITKAKRNFTVRLIAPSEYKEELYFVQKAAFGAYPASYRPTIHEETFKSSIDHWGYSVVFGAFSVKTGALCGYAGLYDCNSYINLSVLKTNPASERDGVNAALVYEILCYYEKRLSAGLYISDGERSIQHITAFQNYLEKYFQFRKAYCHLHIAYPPAIRAAVRLLYPCRRLLEKWDAIRFFHKINGVLRMEEISREQHHP
ncbi:MAG TPA: hypothetical protein H9674_02020 [Firmicutes bacterium]|nr:hypothetical protein [Bacillota bacterium]